VSTENATMIFGREMRVLEVRTKLLGQPPPLLVCRQDQQPPFALERDVAPDDRQNTLADATAADDDDSACKVEPARKEC
jgi:hypothetical protein